MSSRKDTFFEDVSFVVAEGKRLNEWHHQLRMVLLGDPEDPTPCDLLEEVDKCYMDGCSHLETALQEALQLEKDRREGKPDPIFSVPAWFKKWFWEEHGTPCEAKISAWREARKNQTQQEIEEREQEEEGEINSFADFTKNAKNPVVMRVWVEPFDTEKALHTIQEAVFMCTEKDGHCISGTTAMFFGKFFTRQRMEEIVRELEIELIQKNMLDKDIIEEFENARVAWFNDEAREGLFSEMYRDVCPLASVEGIPHYERLRMEGFVGSEWYRAIYESVKNALETLAYEAEDKLQKIEEFQDNIKDVEESLF